MPEKDELDLLLDSALATYADPGPDSGLERRVLAALEAERASGKESKAGGWSRWLPWAIAVPVAASLLLWVGMGKIKPGPSISMEQGSHSDAAQTAPRQTAATELQHAQRIGPHPPAAKAHQNIGAVSARLKPCPDTEPASLAKSSEASNSCPTPAQDISTGTLAAQAPKLDVFPTPQPLTPQERVLAVVAKQAPVPLRQALAEAQIQDDAPISIAAIHIPPIEPPSQIQP